VTVHRGAIGKVVTPNPSDDVDYEGLLDNDESSLDDSESPRDDAELTSDVPPEPDPGTEPDSRGAR